MAFTIQDGRQVEITDLMLGLGAGQDTDVLTVSTLPTIGNIYKDGYEMNLTDTLTLAEVRAGSLTYASFSGVLGDTTIGFNGDTVVLALTVVVGKIGQMYILAKTTAPVLSINDSLPREIPPLLANKLAHEIAARVLERGDRQSDAQMAFACRSKFMEAKLNTIAAINSFGGAFDRIEAI